MCYEPRVRVHGNADEFGTGSVEVREIPLVNSEALSSKTHLIKVEVGNLLLADQVSFRCHAKRLAANVRRALFGAAGKQSKSK